MTLPAVWRWRYIFSGTAVFGMGFSSIAILSTHPQRSAFLLVVLVLFRVFNLLRIIKNRMHPQYLRRAVRRTSLWLVVYHIGFVAFLELRPALSVHFQVHILYAVGVLMTSLVTISVTIRNIIKSRHIPVREYFADRDLPTVTVAIPARNETQDLEDMLRTVIASNYPKLEVIVLDDCSEDKTPEIIRQFAHDGVRFLPGHPPQQRWLAKNLAYQRLAEEANGELILFAGVDVRFGPEAIKALVSSLLIRKKTMISVLPRRLAGSVADAFVQPMRYWWELTLPRRPFNRPAVVSTCWLVNRKALEELGGFGAVSHAIIPEGYFAREFVKRDGYSFIRADDQLDVQTRKSTTEQIRTAIRMHYPQFRRRPEWVLLAVSIHMAVLMVPLAIALSSIWAGFDLATGILLASTVLLAITHVLIIQVTNPSNALVAVVNLPFAAMSELILTMVSMYLYEFGAVEWKGRNITPQVMHVVPHLPPLPEKTGPTLT